MNPGWQQHAACRGQAALFDLAAAGSGVPDPLHKVAIADVKQVCAACPVSVDCLDQALGVETMHGEWSRWGVWGGLTEVERRGLVRAREWNQATRRTA